MNQSCAYLNGRWITAGELAIPISDAGFVLGATVTEQLRTFGGELFQLDAHLARLTRSLEIAGIHPTVTADELAHVAGRVAQENYRLLERGDDLGVGIFITPGTYPTLAALDAKQSPGPTVCVYAYPLPFGLWAHKYCEGDRIAICDIRQPPPETMPPELKCRSRMHYFIADGQAAQRDPGARAILLDGAGMVSEATTANIVLYIPGEGLVSPPKEKILPGISLDVLFQLAGNLGLPIVHRDIPPAELSTASEIILASTTVCLLPVVRCDRRPIADGKPGPIFAQLLDAWNAHVGLDIAAQAEEFATQ